MYAAWLMKMDFAMFAVLSIGGAAAVDFWLRRRRSACVPSHAWAALLVMVAGSWFLAARAERFEREKLQSMLGGFAPTYAQELQRMGHCRLPLDAAADDPLYLAMIDAEKRWLRVNPAIADIYTFRKTPEGRIVLFVDSETDYDHDGIYTGERESRTPIGEFYDSEQGPALGRAWQGIASFDDVIYTDRWGTWISAYVPMRDSAGRIEAVLGVDYPAADWVRTITMARLEMLLIMFVLQATLLGASTAISLLQAEVHERSLAESKLAAHQADLERVITERTEALLGAQRQILRNEKLACVGQLAAGVAHEINTPIQYIGDNIRAISANLDEMLAIDTKYRELVELIRRGQPAAPFVQEIEDTEQEHDLQYLLEDTPKAILQSLEGVERVTHIVRAMKDFSHLRDEGYSEVDLNALLQSTLTITRNEYKYVADVQTELAELPMVECSSSEIGQVLLNLIVNAAHAIAETGKRGMLTIRTSLDDEAVEITIADTGTGIPEDIRDKIFDPFFTTKPVGKGTGQGLGIARDIMIRHGGSLEFDTRVGAGTEFRIRLPIVRPETVGAGAGAT